MMRRELEVLPIGIAWRHAGTKGVVVAKLPHKRQVKLYAAVGGSPPRMTHWASNIVVEVLQAPPFAIPREVQDEILAERL